MNYDKSHQPRPPGLSSSAGISRAFSLASPKRKRRLVAQLRGDIEENSVPQTEEESRPSIAAAARLQQLEVLAEDIIFVAETIEDHGSGTMSSSGAGRALEEDLAASVLRAAQVLRKEQVRRRRLLFVYPPRSHPR